MQHAEYSPAVMVTKHKTAAFANYTVAQGMLDQEQQGRPGGGGGLGRREEGTRGWWVWHVGRERRVLC